MDTACILGLVHKDPSPDVGVPSLDLELGPTFPVVPRIRIAFLKLGPTFLVFPFKTLFLDLRSRRYHQGFCGPLAKLSGILQP